MSNDKKPIIEEKDPDWMYKPILNGRFSKRSKEEQEVCGNGDGW